MGYNRLMIYQVSFLLLGTIVSVTTGFSINLTDIEVNDDNAKNITGPVLLNLFDSITNITMDIDGLFEEFEEGFEDIRHSNQSEKENTTEVGGDSLSGSSIVVNIFDTLRDLTEDVGDVVTDVGAGLAEKRPEFIEVTHDVDSKLTTFGSGLFGFAQSIFQGTQDFTEMIVSNIHRRTKWQE